MKRLIPLVILLFGCSGSVQLADPTPTLFVLPTLPIPSATPRPTRLPTDTPTPDPALTATAEVIATLSALATAEVDYFDAVTASIETAAAAESDFKFQLELLEIDATLLNDPGWLADLDAAVAAYQAATATVMQLSPPTTLLTIHTTYTDALRACSDAYALVAQGARSQDVDTLNEALNLVNRCNARMAEVIHEVEQWTPTTP
jgi:hypothetical protein